jgi:hypothetical protein
MSEERRVTISGGTFALCFWVMFISWVISNTALHIATAIHRLAWAVEHLK